MQADSYGVAEYHEESKHRRARYAPGPAHLDWANQPDPFRVYAGAQRVALPLGAENFATPYRALHQGERVPPAPFDLEHLAILFELSMALSAWKEYGGGRWALRCNPSSGNLHPTESYLIARALPGLAGGAYHYLSRDHAFERRAALGEAEALLPAGGALIALTTIHWREAWKYGMRAFRYCQHDCGHALGALAYAAAALGWSTSVLLEAGDGDVSRIAGIDRDADFALAEREAPECLLWVAATDEMPNVEALAAHAGRLAWAGHANRLSAEHAAWPQIDAAQTATVRPRTVRSAARPSSARRFVPALDLAAERVIRQRRSAVDFDGVTHIDEAAFYTQMEATLPDARVPPWNAWPEMARVHLALFVHRVDGLERGLYLLAREPAALPALKAALRSDWLWRKCGPAHLELQLLLPYDLRQAAKLVSCHQDIAADSCFSLGMLADFSGLDAAPWRYRELYWECGLVGQALYLEAEAAGIRATGIGCFFDDEMHGVLGMRDRAFQSLYHFTAGAPVEDPRLATYAPYSR